MCALVLTAVAVHPTFSEGQEAGGSIRGRVTVAGRAPDGAVRVVAQSPGLITRRELLTSREGDYLFSFLPAGDYVVTFTREGLVTVKRTTRLAALEAVLADTVMSSSMNPDASIVVVIDRDSFPYSPAFSENHQRATLERLPLSGGLLSALTLSPGVWPARLPDASITLDGAPIRFAGSAPGRPLLDPGAAALQEATVVSAGVPTEAGRFQSGLIAIVTRPGGDRLSGALGATVTNSDMNADVIERARATDGAAVNGYYQVGGPLDERRTRLFAAGRHLAESVTQHAPLTGTSFSSPTRERFWEARAAHAVNPDHRLEGLLVSARRNTRQASPANALSVEHATALEDRTYAHRLVTGSYTGVLGRSLQFTARVTGERSRSAANGPERSDLMSRTAVHDRQTGAVTWAPGSCATCDPDERTSTTWRAAASYPLSMRSDVHQITAGYERSFGRLDPTGVPPGGAFELVASRFLVRSGGITPVLEPNGSAEIVWRPPNDNRLTHGSGAFFVSDEWRRGPNLTIQAGLRWDRQRLSRPDRVQPILTESGVSPRVSVSWSPPYGAGWVVTSGYARYAGDPLHGIDTALAGPAERRFLYQGPAVNTSSNPNVVETRAVVDDALNWLFANGGTGRAPSSASEPGLTTARPRVGRLPHESEWSIGASQAALGAARFRADVIWRRAGNLREWRVDPTSSPTADAAGHALDQATAARTDLLERSTAALGLQLHYDLGVLGSFAGRYTLSRSWGTADPFATRDDLFRAMAFAYPEYVDATWSAPSGDLPDDRRHRLKLSAHADVLVNESLGTVGIDLLHSVESGRPYGLVSLIDVSPFVENPGYVQPPTAVRYYFTARDAFRTPSANRTDLAVTYTRPVPGSMRSELLVQFHVLNLFDGRRVLDPQTFAVATTAFTDPDRLVSFNPFAQSPERGVHWDVDPRLSSAPDAPVMTMPRAYRLSVGLRF